MTTPFIQPGQPGGRDPIQGTQSTQSSSGNAKANKTDGPAFRVLLERLQAQAAELEETSRTLDDAADLPSAVDVARASLDDAVSLSDQLLEAFREARHQPDKGSDSE